MTAERLVKKLGNRKLSFASFSLNTLNIFTSQSGGVLRTDSASFQHLGPQGLYILSLSHL